ncbi:MAG: electron transfer flavoprotein subunit alpha/FixB family protein [Pirellulales bacterium]|nr:electron transfer flavoprotein subunit alpha/FixB family protein [Pirellulales bacterium]
MAKDVLVLAEVYRDALADVTWELLAAGRTIASATGGQVLALVLGPNGAAHAPALGAADRIMVVDDPRLADYAPGPYVAALQEVTAAEQPRAVLLGATSIGWDVAPLLAARINAPLVTGCKEIQPEGEALRVATSFCGGKMMAEVRVDGAPAICMVLPGSFRPADAAGQAKIEPRKLPSPLEPGAVRFDGWVLPEAGDVDITQQDVLVSVGRGIQQKDNLELAENLAGALGGAVCASRPVIDQGWLPATRQVGKSGMTVKPKFYLALGISGAPEHQEGMKGADLIIAVNTDPQAPIFDIAHYGAEVDVLDLLPALTEAIEAKRG